MERLGLPPLSSGRLPRSSTGRRNRNPTARTNRAAIRRILSQRYGAHGAVLIEQQNRQALAVQLTSNTTHRRIKPWQHLLIGCSRLTITDQHPVDTVGEP